MSVHESHPAIKKRLRRSEGHIRSIVKMLEEGRSCLQLAQQLQAVEKAIANAKKTLIHDHIDHCLSDDGKGSRHDIKELKEISKYL